ARGVSWFVCDVAQRVCIEHNEVGAHSRFQRARISHPHESGQVARRRHNDLHRRHPGDDHVLHLLVRTPRPVSVGSKRHAHARRIQLRQIAGLNPVKGLRLRIVFVGLLDLREFCGRKARPQPAPVLLHPAIREIGCQGEVRTRLEHGHRLVVDVFVANAVRERVEPGAHETLRIVHVEDVRSDPQPAIVRLVDDGDILRRGHLLDFALSLVDPCATSSSPAPRAFSAREKASPESNRTARRSRSTVRRKPVTRFSRTPRTGLTSRSSKPSRPRLSAPLTPKKARCFKSRMSPSRVVLRWVCVSTIIGITVLPARLTRVPPAGTRTSAVGPTCAILAPSTTSVAFSITRPSPTINRAPSYAVTDCADAGIANPPRKPRVTIAATAATFIRCMGTSCIKKYAS